MTMDTPSQRANQKFGPLDLTNDAIYARPSVAGLLADEVDAVARARSRLPTLPGHFTRSDLAGTLIKSIVGGQTRTAFVGAAGVGKSVLAARVSREVAGLRRSRAFWVDASNPNMDRFEWQRILLSALRLPLNSLSDRPSEQVRLLRAHLSEDDIIVLDGVIDQRMSAEIVESLPNVTWITTSRLKLRYRARVEEIAPFSHRLSVELVRATVPSATPKLSAQIADLCGGVPLAIAIAGKALSRNGADVGDLLGAASSPTLREQSGLVFAYELAITSIISSDGSFAGETARTFVKSGKVLDYFDADLAASLFGIPVQRCMRVMKAMREVGLITSHRRLGYRVHEGICSEGEGAPSSQEHLSFTPIIQLVKEKSRALAGLDRIDESSSLWGLRTQDELPSAELQAMRDAVGWLEANWFTIRKLLEQIVRFGPADQLLDLITSLRPYLGLARRYSETTQLEELLLSTSRTTDDLSGQLQSLYRLVADHMDAGDWIEADLAQAEAIKLARRIASPDVVWRDLLFGGMIALKADRLPEAEARLSESLQLARSLKAPILEAETLVTLAELHGATNESDASGALNRACALLLDIESEPELGVLWLKMGRAWLSIGKVNQAQESIGRAIKVLQETGDLRGLAGGMELSGQALELSGDYSACRVAYDEALNLHRKFGDRGGEIRILTRLGSVAAEQSSIEEAIAFYRTAITLSESTGEEYLAASALINLGMVYAVADLNDEAEWAFRDAQNRADAVGDLHASALALANLGALYLRGGNVARALSPLQESLRLFERLADRGKMIAVSRMVGQAALKLDDLDLALAVLEGSVSLSRMEHDQEAELEALVILGRVYAARGLSADAEYVALRTEELRHARMLTAT